jgi:light-regulated signal transduction histidine kinase (bacteriophytochrome)
MSVIRQADCGVLGLNQQQVELVDYPGTERLGSTTHGSNASSAAHDLRHDNPTNDYLSRNMVDETVNSLPAEEALVYTECGEYAFASEKGHGVVTGKRAQFTRCEDEEIHIPGSIQPHGMLIGLEMIGDTHPQYLVRVVSENSEAICKHTPRTLLALNDFVSIFFSTYRLTFEKCALKVRTQFKNMGRSQEPKVFPIEFQDPEGSQIAVWCAVHFVGGSHNLLVCEFELRSSQNVQTTSSDLPSTPYASLDSKLLDTASSFINKSTPLNIDLHDTFKEGSTMELLDVVSQVQHQLSSQKDIQGLLDTIVGLMMQLTGYHRCMVYKFGMCLIPKRVFRF